MGAATKIQWCDHTASPWYGCAHAHAGCENCYAEAMAKRNPSTLGIWGTEGTRVKSKSFIPNLRKWNAQAERAGVETSVFPSLCDPFEDRPELEDWRREMFAVIDECLHVRLLLLTKRPENIRRMWHVKKDRRPIFPGMPGALGEPLPCFVGGALRPNVWLITSVSEQEHADVQIPELLNCRDLAPVLGLSCEPLLGPINLLGYLPEKECDECGGRSSACRTLGHRPASDRDVQWQSSSLDWLIVGGESGPGPRPCDVAWIRSIRDQCQSARVPVFVKQLGATIVDRDSTSAATFPDSMCWPAGFRQDGQRILLRDQKGGDWSEWPEDLRVRQMPQLEVA